MTMYIIFLIWILNGARLGGIVIKKEKTCVDRAEDDRIQMEYETEHYTDYKMKLETYSTWPELDRFKTKEICQKYLRKLYPRTILNMEIHRFVSVNIYYKLNLEYRKTFGVGALECRFLQPNDVQRVYYFARAPDPGCMYLLNRQRTSRSFFIILKICNSHTHLFLRKTGGLKRALSGSRRDRHRTYKDSVDKQTEHEMNHARDFEANKDVYKRNPELEKRDFQECCPFLLKKLFPKTTFKNIRSSFQSLTLAYIRILEDDGREYKPFNVPAFACFIHTKSKNNNFLFIRAPKYSSWSCVFYVTKTINSVYFFHITKLFCDDEANEDGQNKTVSNPTNNLDVQHSTGNKKYTADLDDNIDS